MVFENYEEWLREANLDHTETTRCECGASGAASTFGRVGVGHPWKCSNCLMLVLREAEALPSEDWSPECEAANSVRAERNRRLESSAWAVLPGSPLTLNCQTAWAAYRAALNSITVRFALPSEVQWPAPPETHYANL